MGKIPVLPALVAPTVAPMVMRPASVAPIAAPMRVQLRLMIPTAVGGLLVGGLAVLAAESRASAMEAG